MTNYHRILGISSSASESEIKKTYRKKVRLFHPDVSTLPDAQERFIEVNEAYEYLLNRKSGKVFSESKKKYQKPRQHKRTKTWGEEEREKSRARARKHAQMRYKSFKNTRYYKNEMALDIIGDNFMFYSLIAFCVVPAVFSLSRGGSLGLLFSLIFGLAGIPIWQGALRKESNVRISLFLSAIKQLLFTKTFMLFMLIAVNILLFFNIVMHTLIPLYISFPPILAAIAGGYALVRAKSYIRENAYNRTLFAFVIIPGLYQLLFVLNFVFSSSPTAEVYTYKMGTSTYYSRRSRKPKVDKTPILHLEDGAYDQFLGIRMFWRFNALEDGKALEYHFAEGLFGIKVLRSYRIVDYREYREKHLHE